jgi:hypothetical protein
MNKEDIIRMAREVGLADSEGVVHAFYQLESFAALVASAERESLRESFRVVTAAEASAAILHEREACARVCESIDMEAFGVLPVRTVMITNHCAEAIRARGQA